ncbi:unnamed protein product [Caenorhabditis bovis]|uniref:Uncharacterized protein n=1 Tax=Caenorhabditis bovis TaxID=2654633 RepID=A0A8S1EXU7_9PELO|nr:unnamed protein product [Caenorhabditis bovis]
MMLMMRSILVLLVCVAVASPWVIYRKNQKKKLICREEAEWNAASASPNSATEHSDSAESSERTPRRSRRDIDVDPIHREPIIFLGPRGNSSVFIDDGDFDIVSDHLSKKELEYVKKRIMETCNALNSN